MPFAKSRLKAPSFKIVMAAVAVGLIITGIYPKILSGFGMDEGDSSARMVQSLALPVEGADASAHTQVAMARSSRGPADPPGSSGSLENPALAQQAAMIQEDDIRTALDAPENPTSYESFELEDTEVARPEWNEYTLRRGDRLSALWANDWDLPRATLYRLLNDRDNARVLNRVRDGQRVEWQTDEEGYLTRLRIWTSRTEGTEWQREEDGWDFTRKTVENQGEISHLVITAQVDGSISAALAQRQELSGRAAGALAVLLDRHLPVRARARTGDSFTLLVEQETLPGEDEPYHLRLLAFDYRGEHLSATAARHANGRFYTPDGEGLLPPFDRRPFAGHYRISSPFDTRRRHPITGRVAPHHGTDFAMPIGTLIQAPADGRVTRVDSHPLAGRFLVIEHGQGYTTRYLHLSRALVRPGQTVERGDRIALSGNTGRSTGPHLHYELHVSGRPVDAMRAELPESDSLAGEELERFKEISSALLAEVKQSGETRRVAMSPFSDMAM
ncbi:peptidoglycan DD-metalloendopeptidase family protein [Ectothiorhodospira sp. 9100]|nr:MULTISPECIES: peptidoglycan DD-metalloendopeptidase family protein [unclassified Ectothiorhodospira]MCG5516342.1 peptidoglycan DD-metalloendopeptidase family protein [Ectothiorhodospira sp. 9100]MCG5518404.1 peptidoglycan DD-metalloendopeptidase family protein [Ectothiorhodospira sp. 9905]